MPGNFWRGQQFSQIQNQSWSSNSGLSTTIEHVGTYQRLVAISTSARSCGYRQASLERVGDGKKIWRLRLTYVGRNPETISGGKAQIELHTSHWLTNNRLETLPLWKHPKYEPLLFCEVYIRAKRWQLVRPTDPNIDLSDAVEVRYTPVNITTPTGLSYPGTIRFDATYPYTSVLQMGAEAWRSTIRSQLDRNFETLLLNRPLATGELQIQSDQIGFVNLTDNFNVEKHLVCRLPQTPGSEDLDYYNLLPQKSTLAPNMTPTQLASLAQDFANNILARRDTQQWNRMVVSNDKVVSEEGGTFEDFKGADQVWSSTQIANEITRQIQIRDLNRRRSGSPIVCLNPDYGWGKIVNVVLSPSLINRYWIKRYPTIKQVGQGRIQIHIEWESKLFPEIHPSINSIYRG